MNYKLWVYGTPFSGKSYFADSFPNAYVINTDGNLQFYKNATGRQVTSYTEFVQALQEFDNGKYDTLIIDLIDHVYDMCREEFLTAQGVEHEADVTSAGGGMAYGKGYTLLREQFWYMMSKIRNLPCNLVLLSHDAEKEEKGKLGIMKTIYAPATLPKQLVGKMCGIMHFVGRCYREGDNHVISFGSNDNETSGNRLPIKSKVIANDYDSFIENLEKEN